MWTCLLNEEKSQTQKRVCSTMPSSIKPSKTNVWCQKSEECLPWGGGRAPGRGSMKWLWEMFSFYFLNFIERQLIYNVVLIFHSYTHICSFSYDFLLWFIAGYWKISHSWSGCWLYPCIYFLESHDLLVFGFVRVLQFNPSFAKIKNKYKTEPWRISTEINMFKKSTRHQKMSS